MKKRKLLYIGVAVATFLAGVGIASYALLPSRSFTLVDLDGAGGTSGLGVSGRGIAYSSSAWISSDGQTVDEMTISYQSAQDAENDFQAEKQRAEQIIKLTKSRLVGKFGASFSVISLNGEELRYITSPQLEAALDYERSWSKYFSVVPQARSH